MHLGRRHCGGGRSGADGAPHPRGAGAVGAKNGTALGWVTARGLLGWISRDRNLASARDAITEQVTAIERGASVRVELYALSTAGTIGCSSGGGRTRCPRG